MRSATADTRKSQPASTARMHRSANYAAAIASNKVLLDVITFDPSGCIDLANSRWRCLFPGYYKVDAEASGIANGPQFQPGIYKNGSQFVGGTVFTPNVYGAGGTVSDIIPCAIGDYLELWCWLGAASTIVGASNNTWMAISLFEPRR